MTTIDQRTRRVSLVFADTVHDLAVPDGMNITQLLAAGGFYSGVLAVRTDGKTLGADELVGDALQDGEVVSLIAVEEPRRHSRRRTRERARAGGPKLDGGRIAVLTGLVLTVAALGAYSAVWLLPGKPMDEWTRAAGAAALGVVALLLAMRPGQSRAARAGRLVAPVCAGTATVAALAVAKPGTDRLSVVAALAVAAALAALTRLQFRDRDEAASVATTALLGAAVLAVVAYVLSWPGYAAPALLAAVGPLVVRALPSLSIDVPDEQLIDTERLSNTSWSARTGIKLRRRPVRQLEVGRLTSRARELQGAGTAAVSIFSVVGMAVAFLGGSGQTSLVRWGAFAEGLLLVIAYGLAPRTLRDTHPKTYLRTAAALILVMDVLAFKAMTPEGVFVGALIALIMVAVIALMTSAALASGWRSIAISRLADGIEGLAVVFTLPCGILAADIVDVIRQAMSG